jgi:hypothetical protein
MEYFDATKLTIRVADCRVLRTAKENTDNVKETGNAKRDESILYKRDHSIL